MREPSVDLKATVVGSRNVSGAISVALKAQRPGILLRHSVAPKKLLQHLEELQRRQGQEQQQMRLQQPALYKNIHIDIIHQSLCLDQQDV